MKKVLYVMALVVLTLGVQAQNLNYGVRFGMNASKLKGNKESDIDNDFKGRIGFHVGAAVDYEFMTSMFVESGLYITTKGAKYDKDGEEYKYNVTYLQLPILYSYKYDLGISDLKLHGKIGPYFALGLAAKQKYEDSYDPDYNYTAKGFGKSDNNSNDAKTGLKRGDVGFLLGMGVSKGHYYLGLNYELGFVNIDAYSSESDYKGKVHTRNFSISLGYNF